MINGNLDQFLDTGWFSEATLYYNGYIYWLEAQTDDIESVFFIDRWKAQNEDNNELRASAAFYLFLHFEHPSMEVAIIHFAIISLSSVYTYLFQNLLQYL